MSTEQAGVSTEVVSKEKPAGPAARFDPARVVCRESDAACSALRGRLDEFYEQFGEYAAFQRETHKPQYWGPIRERLEGLRSGLDRRVRVLEFGAGMTGFSKYLGEDLRGAIDFTVQDVTGQNLSHLEAVADRAVVGDVSSVEGEFEVIFSTFVWEHVSNPAATLKVLLSKLAPGGTLYLSSPKYDTPGYVPASAGHYGLMDRIRLAMWLRGQRRRALKTRTPSFFIHSDPAMFHVKWFPDADAIHWVSRHDLALSLPAGYTIRDIAPEYPKAGIKQAIFTKLLLMFVEISAPG